MDECATTAIEEFCDILQQNIKLKLNQQERYITSRYSPGDGDLSININEDIINLLDASKKIGLTITKDKIMIPRKLVIAIIGIQKIESIDNKKICLECSNYDKCKYKKGDESYECKKVY